MRFAFVFRKREKSYFFLIFSIIQQVFYLRTMIAKKKIDLSSLLVRVHFVRKEGKIRERALRFEISLMTLKKKKNFWSLSTAVEQELRAQWSPPYLI